MKLEFNDNEFLEGTLTDWATMNKIAHSKKNITYTGNMLDWADNSDAVYATFIDKDSKVYFVKLD